MNLLDTNSLAHTLDNLNDKILRGEKITENERVKIAHWLASIQGKPRSYRGMFAIATNDKKNETKLFTGELLNSNASLGHILGEEALRALLWLDVREKPIQIAIANAIASFTEYTGYRAENPPSMFCCGKCTDAVLRVMKLIDESEAKRYIQSSLKAMKSLRDGNGKWRRFPFYYTLYALLDLPGAEEELRYALPVLDRSLKTARNLDSYGQRKLLIKEQILTRLR
jgi:hypothetical protein